MIGFTYLLLRMIVSVTLFLKKLVTIIMNLKLIFVAENIMSLESCTGLFNQVCNKNEFYYRISAMRVGTEVIFFTTCLLYNIINFKVFVYTISIFNVKAMLLYLNVKKNNSRKQVGLHVFLYKAKILEAYTVGDLSPLHSLSYGDCIDF